MNSKMTLNAREIDRIYDLFEKMNESGEYGYVELESESDSGIGSTLHATFYVTHKETEGYFKVTITDESNW